MNSTLQSINPEYLQLKESFKAWVTTMGYSKSAQYEFPRALHEFFMYLESHKVCNLACIKASMVETFFEYLKVRPNFRREGGLSIAYLKKHAQALKLFFKYIRLTRKTNISFYVRFEKSISKVTEFLSKDEIYDLFEHCENTAYGIRDRCMLAIIYGCGLSVANILLQPNDMRCIEYIFSVFAIYLNPKCLFTVRNFLSQIDEDYLTRDIIYEISHILIKINNKEAMDIIQENINNPIQLISEEMKDTYDYLMKKS